MLTIPPAVEPPELQLTDPTFQLTWISLPLLPPISFLTLTSYLPEVTDVSTSKTTDVLLTEVGVITVVRVEMVWRRATSAKLFESTRLLPVMVRVLVEVPETETVVEEMLSILGESVSLRYEN